MSHLQPVLESQYGVITPVYPMNITGTIRSSLYMMNSDGVTTSLYMMNTDGIITSLYMLMVSLHHCIC